MRFEDDRSGGPALLAFPGPLPTDQSMPDQTRQLGDAGQLLGDNHAQRPCTIRSASRGIVTCSGARGEAKHKEPQVTSPIAQPVPRLSVELRRSSVRMPLKRSTRMQACTQELRRRWVKGCYGTTFGQHCSQLGPKGLSIGELSLQDSAKSLRSYSRRPGPAGLFSTTASSSTGTAPKGMEHASDG